MSAIAASCFSILAFIDNCAQLLHSSLLLSRLRALLPQLNCARTSPSDPTMANPFIPPPQPCRRWRYPGQNFALIQHNRADLSWVERTRSWVNDVPAGGGDQGTQLSKRKVLEELHNTNTPSTQDCEVSSLKRQCLLRSSKRMTGGPTQDNGGDERRGQLSSSTRGSESNRGRPRGRRGRRAGAGRGSVRPMVDHDMNNEDDSLATGRPTPNNPPIIQI